MPDPAPTMLLAGDVFVQRADPESMYVNVASYTRQADILFANLESSLTDVGVKGGGMKEGGFRSEERMLAAYQAAGFNVFGQANNHSMDYGLDGLYRCIEVLDKAGIAHTGAGRDAFEARKPAIVERHGTRVAFLSYTCNFHPMWKATEQRGGINTVRVSTAYEPISRLEEYPGAHPIIRTTVDPKDLSALLENIRDAKAGADVLVLSCHWGIGSGIGGIGQLVGYEPTIAHAAIDAGADVIIGAHAHMTEPVEVYRGKPVFYGMGEFGFDLWGSRQMPWYRRAFFLVRCLIQDHAIEQVSIVPVRINPETSQPSLQTTSEAADLVERLRELSHPFGTRFLIEKDEVVVETRSAVAV